MWTYKVDIGKDEEGTRVSLSVSVSLSFSIRSCLIHSHRYLIPSTGDRVVIDRQCLTVCLLGIEAKSFSG